MDNYWICTGLLTTGQNFPLFPHHSSVNYMGILFTVILYRPDALPIAQPTQLLKNAMKKTLQIHSR